MDLFDLRKEYRNGTLDESSVHENPVKQFEKWFEEACASKLNEPNAMVISTVGVDGRPSSRVVLLKSFDEKGFVFFTNYESRKGKELEQNPFASLLFFWPELERQVRIEGRAERISRAESMAYYFSRPVNSRLGAWASMQSAVIESRRLLEKKWEEMKARFEGKEIPLPDFWGGYRIVPDAFEFWQGRESRLHDRIAYKKSENGWKIVRLSP
jgi:pyridoxamine 5'-phosphate oxidase